MLNMTKLATSGKLKSLVHFLTLTPPKIEIKNRIYFLIKALAKKILANLNSSDIPRTSSLDAAGTGSK